jgi:hypothetical protein
LEPNINYLDTLDKGRRDRVNYLQPIPIGKKANCTKKFDA